MAAVPVTGTRSTRHCCTVHVRWSAPGSCTSGAMGLDRRPRMLGHRRLAPLHVHENLWRLSSSSHPSYPRPGEQWAPQPENSGIWTARVSETSAHYEHLHCTSITESALAQGDPPLALARGAPPPALARGASPLTGARRFTPGAGARCCTSGAGARCSISSADARCPASGADARYFASGASVRCSTLWRWRDVLHLKRWKRVLRLRDWYDVPYLWRRRGREPQSFLLAIDTTAQLLESRAYSARVPTRYPGQTAPPPKKDIVSAPPTHL